MGWEYIISKVLSGGDGGLGVGGVVSICLEVGEGDRSVHPLGPPFPLPHPPPSPSTSMPSSSTLFIYLLPPPPPPPPYTTHHPQLNGWLTQGLLGYMLRVFPTQLTHTYVRVCVCVCAWAKMVDPTSYLRFKHSLLLCPLVPLASNSPSAAPLFFRTMYTRVCLCVCMYV